MCKSGATVVQAACVSLTPPTPDAPGTPLPRGVAPRYCPGVTGAEVRRIRHGLQLTQAALARVLGVTRVTVARWESGVYAIPEPTARLLQRVRNEGRRAKRRQ
jgi:DNA-binding XRE family transcriptional regulator